MSKERELLARVLTSELWSVQKELQAEIKELLAQPEPEQSSKWWYGKGVEDTKYFLKRKPLSEDKLDVLAEANITDEGIAGYYLGFRDAEKYHNIGE